MRTHRAPIQLNYQAGEDLPKARPPVWTYFVFALYGLLVAALFLSPFVVAMMGAEQEGILVMSGTATGLICAGLTLFIVPVRLARRRPVQGTILWLPLAGSGLLASLLLLGAVMAAVEGAADVDRAGNAFPWILAGAALVWVLWTLILWWLCASVSSILAGLHRWLVGGSIVELLIAVPTHVVVRRRNECCAGVYTGTAIGIGVVVMLVALGPSVLLLYYRRWKRILPRTPAQSNG